MCNKNTATRTTQMTEFEGGIDDDALRAIEMPEKICSDEEDQSDKIAQKISENEEEVSMIEVWSEVEVQEKVQEREDVRSEVLYSVSEYREMFTQSNKKFGLSKLHGSVSPELFYVRPRNRMPTIDMPNLFVAEGLQRNDNNSLMCPGRCFFFGQSTMFVTLGIIWVSHS